MRRPFRMLQRALLGTVATVATGICSAAAPGG